MIAFLVGLAIGFVMCIPVGPINVWVINTHVKKGADRALAIALGGSVMDFIYFFLILSGLSFISFTESVSFSLKSAGIILIFILGLKELLTRQSQISKEKAKSSLKNVFGSFLFGVLLYTSNPTLILTMTGLAAFIKSLELFEATLISHIILSLGLAIGSFGWFVFLVMVVNKYQEQIRNKYLHYFTKISGALMIGLSLFMSHQLFFR